MAITNFISTIWSETLYRKLNAEYVAVKNCSREFEGSILGQGSTVKILGVGDITVSDYAKNTDMASPSALTDNARSLTINRAKAFNFLIDDVDHAQAAPGLMELAMEQAAAALADEADKYVFSLYSGVTAANTVTDAAVTVDSILDDVIAAREKLLANGVGGSVPTVLEVSPEIAAILLKAKILNSTDNDGAVSNGAIGSLIGFEVYVSPNVAVSTSDKSNKCFARTKRAIAFAEQLNSVEAYRPELRFADGVKGLHLYGAKIIYPDEIVLLNLTKKTSTTNTGSN